MPHAGLNSHGTLRRARIDGVEHRYHEICVLGDVSHLPLSVKILLESAVRAEDGRRVSADIAARVARWRPDEDGSGEVLFTPSRVVMNDFTGIPALIDLSAMADSLAALGGDRARVSPVVPTQLVVDHSVIADRFGDVGAFGANIALEHQRNRERFQLLRWVQRRFPSVVVVPPGTGILHQVNIERLAQVVTVDGDLLHPDTLVGTDSHTTMVNGLGVLGWGVGGIEALAAMLGQPLTMALPPVVGVELSGQLPAGATATDMVLTIARRLRGESVVGSFVEFFGAGLDGVPVEARAAIANMSPEFGSTCALFPIDDQTLRYLRLTGRAADHVRVVEWYAKTLGLWRESQVTPTFSRVVRFDLSTVEPVVAGPARPDRAIPLRDAARQFRADLADRLDR